MRGLLDVNVLIALLDATHGSHPAARAWLQAHAVDGWASCPLTQNGCLRVLSQPAYSSPQPIVRVAELLRRATSTDHHAFWADELSLLDPAVVDVERVHGSRQITDAYLLGLAVSKGGRFVTLDRRIPLSPVPGASAKHLVVI